MIDYGKVKSTIQPEPLVIDEFSVWVCSDIKPVTETIGDETFTGFEYNMVQYEKDEYIRIMAQQNNEINGILNTMLGVTE